MSRRCMAAPSPFLPLGYRLSIGIMSHRAVSLVYVASLVVMVVVGLGYDNFSPGLAAPSSGGPFFCKNLMSSGSDDDAMIFAFVVFVVPLTIRILKPRDGITNFESVAFFLCAFAACFALWLASLDCASIFYTAFVVPDVALAGALGALALSTAMLTCLRFIQ